MVRGRRVNSSGEKSKQLLLEKAIELFSVHGYHQTKISDIVKAANLTQPTFYLYFQSKDSLFNDLNETFRHRVLEIFEQSLFDAKGEMSDVRQLLQYKLSNIFMYFAENPHLTKIGFFEAKESMAVKKAFVHFLVEMLEKDTLHNRELVDSYTFAESFLGAIERVTLARLLTFEQTPQKLAEDLVNIFFVPQLAYSK